MEALKATGRIFYATTIDAPLQLISNLGSTSSVALLAHNTFRALEYHCQDSSPFSFDLGEAAQLMKRTREGIGILLTPKSWNDITKSMSKNTLCTVKGASQITGAIEKTVAMLLSLDKFGATTVAWCIQMDAKCLDGIAAKIGGSELFKIAGMATLKTFRDKMIIATSLLRIIDACMVLSARKVRESKPNTIEAREFEHADMLFFLQCSCEMGKIAFVCIGGSVSGGIVLFGVCSAIMPIAKTLYTTYVIEARQVDYPSWLV